MIYLKSDEEIDLYIEYLELRKKLKIQTTHKIQKRLLEKYFEYGRDKNIIINAINANWKDFYPMRDNKQNQQKSKTLAERNREALDAYEKMYGDDIIEGVIE